ncbi:MAG: sugar phosphate isomerase/epimerase family protein [Candidatus Helarchaeota archaeon]
MMVFDRILLGLDRATWGFSIEEICENLCKIGLDGIELKPEHPELFKNFPNASKNLLDILSSYDFKISIHGPFKDLNISSYNPWIRKISLDIFIKTIDFALNFDKIEYIVFHGGQNSFRSNSRFELKFRKIALDHTIEAFKILLQKSKDAGLLMAIENMTHSDYRMTSKIKYLNLIFAEPELKDLKFIYDYEHGLNYSERYSLRILKNFKDRLIGVHIFRTLHRNRAPSFLY